MIDFTIELKNRRTMPSKQIVICEDDIENQIKLLTTIGSLFDPQGDVEISVISGAIAASEVIANRSLIILDHDMPYGNGMDLLRYIQEQKIAATVITASGIESNNQRMKAYCDLNHIECYCLSKRQVIAGEANSLILSVIGRK